MPGRGLVHTYIVHSLPVTWTVEVSEFLEGWQEEALYPPAPHSDLPGNLRNKNLSLPTLLKSLAFCLLSFAEDEFLLGGEERKWLGGADHSRKAFWCHPLGRSGVCFHDYDICHLPLSEGAGCVGKTRNKRDSASCPQCQGPSFRMP